MQPRATSAAIEPDTAPSKSGLSAEVLAELRQDPAAIMALRSRELDVEETSADAIEGSQVAAFFDIDGTLIKGSIAGHLFAQGVAEGQASRFTFVIFVFYFLLYKLNLIPRQRMYRWAFGLGAGISVTDSTDFVRRCIDNRIRTRVYTGAKEFVDMHRALGHKVVAVTGAPDYAAAQIALHLGFDDVLATPTPVTGSQLGGELSGTLCYAEGKVKFIRAYAAKHNISLTHSYAYSDSRSDVPMLELLGHPVCVNPQWLLRITAWRRRWSILLLRRMGEET